jgi:hypothetical protein
VVGLVLSEVGDGMEDRIDDDAGLDIGGWTWCCCWLEAWNLCWCWSLCKMSVQVGCSSWGDQVGFPSCGGQFRELKLACSSLCEFLVFFHGVSLPTTPTYIHLRRSYPLIESIPCLHSFRPVLVMTTPVMCKLLNDVPSTFN